MPRLPLEPKIPRSTGPRARRGECESKYESAKKDDLREGRLSVVKRKISSSSFSPCQKYLQRKCAQDAKKKEDATKSEKTKMRRKKRHISPYVVRGLGNSRWMSRSEPDLHSLLR